MLEADILLYCVGRDGNTEDLGLERIALRPTDRGLLEVNEFFQTAHPHIYAVGDVIGYPALASTSAEQGRQAIRHAYNVPGPRGKTEVLPFAIYTIPEVSFVGAHRSKSFRAKAVDYVAGHGQYEMNPRGQILGDTDGVLKILCETDSLRLLGCAYHRHGGQRADPHRAGAAAEPGRRLAAGRDDVQLPPPSPTSIVTPHSRPSPRAGASGPRSRLLKTAHLLRWTARALAAASVQSSSRIVEWSIGEDDRPSGVVTA